MPEATPATQTAPTTPEANGSGVIPSLDERSASVFGTEGDGSTQVADQTTPAATDLDANAKARADRRAALEKLKAEERSRVDTMAALRERDDLRRQLAEEREKSKAYATYVNPKELSKEQFFALAEQNPDLSPKELGEWLRERMANPEIAAAHAASRVVDPKLSALEKQNAELRARLDAFEQSQQSAREQAEEQAAAEQFFAFTKENAATSPYSASFLAKHGPEEFYKLAQSAVRLVPPHAGAQAVLDEIEERLTQLGSIYITTPAGDTQRRQAPPTPNPAAAQAPTHVSNTLAQQRSSVVNEDEQWASLPFEERSARLFR